MKKDHLSSSNFAFLIIVLLMYKFKDAREKHSSYKYTVKALNGLLVCKLKSWVIININVRSQLSVQQQSKKAVLE